MPSPRARATPAESTPAWTDAAPALVLLVVTQGSLIWLDPGRPTNALGVAWALSPLLAVAWLARNQVRALRRADELQRVVQLEAMAVGFGVIVILLAGAGVLHGAEIGDLAQRTQDRAHRRRRGVDRRTWGTGEVAEVRNRLREFRAIHNWTQVDLADRLDVSRQTIYAIETGRYDPSLPLAFKISALFDEPIESLFFPARDQSAATAPARSTERSRNVRVQDPHRS